MARAYSSRVATGPVRLICQRIAAALTDGAATLLPVPTLRCRHDTEASIPVLASASHIDLKCHLPLERAAHSALKTSERSKCQTSTPTESGTSRSLLQRAIIADKIGRRKSKSAPHRPFDAQIDDRPNQLSDLVRLPEPSFGTISFSLWGPANF